MTSIMKIVGTSTLIVGAAGTACTKVLVSTSCGEPQATADLLADTWTSLDSGIEVQGLEFGMDDQVGGNHTCGLSVLKESGSFHFFNGSTQYPCINGSANPDLPVASILWYKIQPEGSCDDESCDPGHTCNADSGGCEPTCGAILAETCTEVTEAPLLRRDPEPLNPVFVPALAMDGTDQEQLSTARYIKPVGGRCDVTYKTSQGTSTTSHTVLSWWLLKCQDEALPLSSLSFTAPKPLYWTGNGTVNVDSCGGKILQHEYPCGAILAESCSFDCERGLVNPFVVEAAADDGTWQTLSHTIKYIMPFGGCSVLWREGFTNPGSDACFDQATTLDFLSFTRVPGGTNKSQPNKSQPDSGTTGLTAHLSFAVVAVFWAIQHA